MGVIYITYVDDKYLDNNDSDDNTNGVLIITMISMPVHVMHGPPYYMYMYV